MVDDSADHLTTQVQSASTPITRGYSWMLKKTRQEENPVRWSSAFYHDKVLTQSSSDMKTPHQMTGTFTHSLKLFLPADGP